MSVATSYRAAVNHGELRPDAAQEAVAKKLDGLARALKKAEGFSLFRKAPPKGLYIWGDVGRGKTLLMDLFFDHAEVARKRRAHFNSFMVDIHARIHGERQKAGSDDPIPPVARAIAEEAKLLAFDEFQVTDVADAMILGRLFDRLFAAGVTIVATSNTPPGRLYEGGLNRQLFLPFIAEIQQRMEVLELNGPTDYRLQRMSGLDVYLTPLSPAADGRGVAKADRHAQGKTRYPDGAGPQAGGAAGGARRGAVHIQRSVRATAGGGGLSCHRSGFSHRSDRPYPAADAGYAQRGAAVYPACRYFV
jgi:cell division protein ZapE